MELMCAMVKKFTFFFLNDFFHNFFIPIGDSGGGIVFKQANKWYLRGVVSVSIALQNSLRCDPEHYAVFVDVAKYITWIDRNNS